MAVKNYFLPQSLDEAFALVEKHGPSLLVMAGGTLVMPLINEGVSLPEQVMGLRKAGLSYSRTSNGALYIGATTPLTEMLKLDTYPMLQEAAHCIGGWAIRNMGTVGGNLFAPPPAGDFCAALMALGASVKISKKGAERLLPLEEFYTGFMTNALQVGELVTEIQVPPVKGQTVFLKFGRKNSDTPAIVTVAANLELEGKGDKKRSIVKTVRLVLNGVGPHPMRAKKAEAALVGKILDEKSIGDAAAAAAGESQPFTDAIASEWYRRKMVGVIVSRALSQVAV